MTALTERAPIIIVTIQTFPFVLDAIRDTVTLKDRRFAVIADDYRDTDLEKRSLFFKHLAPLIAEEARHEPIDLAAVTMTHYHLRDLGRRALDLRDPGADYEPLRPLTGLGSGIPRDPPQALLSEIVGRMNELFEGEGLTDADRINYVSHIAGKMMESELLAQQAAANQKTQFGESPDFMSAFEDAVMAAYDNHRSMSEQVMAKGHVKKAMAAILLDLVYRGFEERRGGGDQAWPG